MTPLLLTAVAAALPARLGLINVGAEGQLYMGAWLATAGALYFSKEPAWLLLPLTTALGFVGGALWALLPGALRAAKLVNEAISTLLLNYVAPLIVSFFIFGPWRSAESSSYPQSPAFVDAARLPNFGGTRLHAGLLFGLAALAIFSFVIRRTRAGLAIQAIGGNPEASRRLGIPVPFYMMAVMATAGGLAGLAGMAEVSAIQGRLVAGLSPGYGFIGFLVAWLAEGSASGMLGMAFLFALLSSVGRRLANHPGRPLRGGQPLDGRRALHRPRPAAERGMNASFAAAVLASSILSGTSLLVRHFGRARRRARRNRQPRPRRPDADRGVGRLRSRRDDRQPLSRRRRRGACGDGRQSLSSPTSSSAAGRTSWRPGSR